MIITTTPTPTVEGYHITKYHGMVSGEVITGVIFFKDFFAGIRNIIGGRSRSYEGEIIKAREKALEEIQQRAGELGANAIVGMSVDYETLGPKGDMFMVIITGTAVSISLI